MKRIFNLSVFIIALATTLGSSAQNLTLKKKGLQLSVRTGYDLPNYANDTPYVDYKGGLQFGASADYYWNWYGIGADIYFIQNSPENTFPTVNLFDTDRVTPLTDLLVSEDKTERTFYGLGPSFRYVTKNGEFIAEVNNLR